MNIEAPDTDDCLEVETALQAMMPEVMSSSLMDKLSIAMVDAGVVEKRSSIFGTISQNSSKQVSRGSRSFVGWAAALALLGGVSAFFMTESPSVGTNSVAVSSAESSGVDSSLMDSGLRHDVAQSGLKGGALVSYDGVLGADNVDEPVDQKTLWLNDFSPHKYIKVDYTKTYEGQDKSGNSVEFSLPNSRYILVPTEAY